MAKLPFVTIIIPCRNEERFIAPCLDSVISNDYPSDMLEILVVDGMSIDSSREIIGDYAHRFPNVFMMDNPNRIFPAGVNLGIQSARGELISIMGAHATYAKDYISQCVRFQSEYCADNVGGSMRVLERNDTLTAKAIALVVSHPFGSANATYKTRSAGEPQWVDTVFGGCYKREVFCNIGLFNEKLTKGSDFDLNVRLKKSGGRILQATQIVANYYADATLPASWKHNFLDGSGIYYRMRFGSKPLKWRHLLPSAFASVVLGGLMLLPISRGLLWPWLVLLGLYSLTNCLFSIQLARRQKSPTLIFLLPIAFATRHMAYGMGSLVGLLKLLIPTRPWESTN